MDLGVAMRARVFSIHAPVKGATLAGHVDIIFFIFSIHAPVKGATVPMGRPFG